MDIFPFGTPEFSLPPGDATVQQEYYESRARRDAYIQLFWVSFDGQPARVFALRAADARVREGLLRIGRGLQHDESRRIMHQDGLWQEMEALAQVQLQIPTAF